MPITYADIWYWSSLTGVRPTALEVRALRTLDGMMLNPKKGTAR